MVHELEDREEEALGNMFANMRAIKAVVKANKADMAAKAAQLLRAEGEEEEKGEQAQDEALVKQAVPGRQKRAQNVHWDEGC